MTETKKIEIPLNDEVKHVFHQLLWLTYQKPVIKKANYIDIKTGECGNSCSDIQNFIYEYIGWCVTNEKNCLLTGKYKDDWCKLMKEAKERGALK